VVTIETDMSTTTYHINHLGIIELNEDGDPDENVSDECW
jgi:hypothetical protein